MSHPTPAEPAPMPGAHNPAPAAAFAPPPGYAPAGTAPAPDRARGGRNPWGVAAIISAAVLVLLLVLQLFVQVGILLSQTYDLFGPITGLLGIVEGLVALVTVILGLVGLFRRDRSPLLAAIALGAGGFALVSAVLWNVLYPLILSAA
ncbi:hypothetical protein [Microbacterium invictum]|uniref:Major facilitator superfamily (MFS) profile domain-containing protein n=1 Tax=Microbacterium invictum TaxID=515415 RepID=A0ABZ0VC40_9MICO|nr:hypothetical protein [Microbacterium invictum]WQB70246.1 hypothetical protein T9R20_16340 [Microbacterium invictum]